MPNSNGTPRTTETHYDPAGNKLWVKFPDDQTQQWQNYDAFGQPQLYISERGHPTDLIYCWGPMKKLYKVITYRDGEQGQLTEFGYDLMGRPTKTLFPDTTYEETVYQYGQVKSWRNRRGGKKEIDQYDARGRETHHFWRKPNGTIDSGTSEVTRVWDAANRLTSITNMFSAIEYEYNDAGQMKGERTTVNGAQGHAQINYCRYPTGEVARMTYPNGTSVERFYTGRGQLHSVGWGFNLSTAYDYLPDGKVNFQARTNGVTTSYKYDGRGMIEWLKHRRGEHDLARRDYWRDHRDRILAWKRGTDNYYNGMEDGRGNRYGYDPEGQLTTASYRMPNPEATPGPSPNGAVRMDSFDYDQLGNRKNQNHVANRAQWMTMTRRDNGLNQYSFWENGLSGSAHWESDIFHDDEFGSPGASPGNGDVTADGYLTANYNGLNQPVSMWRNGYGQNYMWFGYDPLGRCVKRWNGPSAAGTPGYQYATYFYYDGWNLVQEGPSAGSTDRTYVHGGRIDEIVASQVGGAWYNHHYDAQGNCILLSTTNGDISEQYDYDAFGWPYFYRADGWKLGMGNVHTRFLFTGREWIMDMRLYDYRNRMYQPELGRFLQPDPKHFGAGDYNLYRYCHNDPVNRTDPFGLMDVDTAIERTLFESGMTLLGMGIGSLFGGGAGSAGIVGGPAVLATVPAGAVAGAAIGGSIGFGVGKALSPVLFKEPSGNNPFGSKGKPDHQQKVSELQKKATNEAGEGETVLRESKIQGLDSNRRPDVQIVDRNGVTRKVFEGERNPNSQRNLLRQEEYKRLGIEQETHPLPPGQ